MDSKNIHNNSLIKRAITYYELQKYDKAFLDLEKCIQLNPSNSFAYYFKGLIHYTFEDHDNTNFELKNCKSSFNSKDNLAKFLLNYIADNYKTSIPNINNRNISLNYLLQYSDSNLRLSLLENYKINKDDFIKLGIINLINKLLYKSNILFIIYYFFFKIEIYYN